MPQRSKRDRAGLLPSQGKARRPSRLTDFFSRLAVLGLCLGFALLLGGLGRHILITGEYDYTLETSDGDGQRNHFSDRDRNVRREVVHATGDWAREQGIGFVASAVTLVLWGVGILWGMGKPPTGRINWSFLRAVFTALSLACCLTAIGAFFPPWRIGPSMSVNAFYLVMAAFLYLTTLRRDRVRERSQKVFPALIASGVVIGSFSSGYLVGIIAGIFLGFLLALHIVLLIPKLREEVMSSEPGTGIG